MAAALGHKLAKNTNPDGGIVYAYHVSDPERYGVVEFDNNNKVISIEEKPINQKAIMRFRVFIFMIMM